jgi:hypothetical protein
MIFARGSYVNYFIALSEKTFGKRYKDHFIKIRFTYPKAQQPLGEKAWEQFLADFGKILK